MLFIHTVATMNDAAVIVTVDDLQEGRQDQESQVLLLSPENVKHRLNIFINT